MSHIQQIMSTGRIASNIYKTMELHSLGASSTEQYGDILTITVDGQDYSYQVQQWDSLASVVREFEKMIKANLVAA